MSEATPQLTGDDAAYARLVARITAEGGFACASYRDGCVRRRVAVRMRATRSATYAAYDHYLSAHATEWPRLLDALTINVTQFYRNPEVFHALATRVLPALWASPGPPRVWSAGCATGEEAWTLAMLVHAQAVASGTDPQAIAHTIHATDVDPNALQVAARGVYRGAALRDLPESLRHAYVSGDPPTIVAALRPLVVFATQDLHRDPPPALGLSLIVCRNVLMYFERPAQEAILRRFHAALAPEGLLLVGKSEALLGDARRWFAPVDPAVRLFRRQA
jgi:chemotaxis protein methyltransferase CheR